MNKKIAAIAIAGASLGLFATASPAGAAHCTAEDGSSPGYSYFGTDHVQESNHAEGAEGVHMGNPGASGCRPADADAGVSPSDRAPGRNK